MLRQWILPTYIETSLLFIISFEADQGKYDCGIIVEADFVYHYLQSRQRKYDWILFIIFFKSDQSKYDCGIIVEVDFVYHFLLSQQEEI
jgi:hypothetical protein